MTWIDEPAVLSELLHECEFAPTQPLDTAALQAGPAVYLWTYVGQRQDGGPHLDLYREWLTATGWPIYIGSAQRMLLRRSRHLRNLRDTRDVSARELRIAAVPMPSHASALFAEALLVSTYRPVWNESWLRGVGSAVSCGRARLAQSPSPWSVLHGRSHPSADAPTRHDERLVARIEEHLKTYVRGARLSATTA